MERQAKQRFLKLRVNRIDLVDNPANEQEFLVIKRKGNPMADETKIGTVPTEEDVQKDAGETPEKDTIKVLNDKVAALEAKLAEVSKAEPKAEPKVEPKPETDVSKQFGELLARLEKIEKGMTPEPEKTEDDLATVTKKLGELTETLTEVSKAVEKIENTRGVSKSVEQDETDGDKTDKTDAVWPSGCLGVDKR